MGCDLYRMSDSENYVKGQKIIWENETKQVCILYPFQYYNEDFTLKTEWEKETSVIMTVSCDYIGTMGRFLINNYFNMKNFYSVPESIFLEFIKQEEAIKIKEI
jgi:hypothetical protein